MLLIYWLKSIKTLEQFSFNHIIVHLRDMFVIFKYILVIDLHLISLHMYFLSTELYIMSICHQIIIHECYLNDRVLTNINIYFSPSKNKLSRPKFVIIGINNFTR